MPSFRPHERKILLIVCILIASLALAVTLSGLLFETETYQYNGVPFDWADIATHWAAMQLGKAGEWKFILLSTPDISQTGYYIKLFYIVLGHLARVLHLSVPVTFYAALFILNAATVYMLYLFISWFFSSTTSRYTSLLLTIFGSGLGWLMYLIQYLPPSKIDPIDFWLIDGHPFFSMLIFPHFSAVIIGLLGMMILFFHYLGEPKPLYLIGMGLTSLVLQAIQSFAPALAFVFMGGILLGLWVKNKKFPYQEVKGIFWVGLSQLPLVAYNFFAFWKDPLWNQFALQNQTLSPPFEYYLWGYGLFWLFLLPGLFSRKFYRDPKNIGLLTWIVGALVLAYLPWQIQRRMMFYYTLPLSILVTYSLRNFFSPLLLRFIPKLQSRKNILLVPLITLFSFSSIYLAMGRIAYFPTHDPKLYSPREVVDALTWLNENTTTDGILLSASETGLLAIAHNGQTVAIAHKMETTNYEQNLETIYRFYQNQITLEEIDIPNLKWIVYGPFEQAINPSFIPSPELLPRYTQSNTTLYEIQETP